MKFIKKSILFLLVFLAFVSCSSTKAGSSAELPLNPAVITGQLDNGMNYYVLKNAEPNNRITLRLVVKAGSNMEDDDQKGVAHFIEHLAFNGTENFEKNKIIDFFETIGMNFGADLNAYTSFNETVYMLEIPADNPEFLDTAMLILHDWASAVTFDQTEIDKERGVVTEEWRLRQGFSGRLTDKLIPFMLKGSIYEKRLPIGSMDVIKNVKRDRILDFYKKWYKPELMSVVVVGDYNTENVMNSMKKNLGVIPASAEKTNRAVFADPVYSSNKEIMLFKDAEQPYLVAEFVNAKNKEGPTSTVADVKESYAYMIASSILNTRLKELSMKADCPYLIAQVISENIINSDDNRGIAFVPKDGKYTEAMKLVLDEYERLILFGIKQNEIDLVKSSLLSGLELKLKNKDKIESATWAGELVDYDVNGNVSLSVEDGCKIIKNAIKTISMDDVMEASKTILPNRGNKLLLLVPEKNKDIPAEKEIKKIWTDYINEELKEYQEDIEITELMKRPAKKAKVVSKKELPELKATEYELENGLKIVTKKTGFVKDQFDFNLISKGGLNTINDEDIPSAFVATEFISYLGVNGYSCTQLQKYIKDKNIRLYASLSDTEERINCSSNNKDFEILLQLINLYVTNPQFTDESWGRFEDALNIIADSFGSRPEDLFYEKINDLVYGTSLRHHSLDKEYAKLINKETVEKVFKSRFQNAADFTVIATGDFDEKKLIDLCCYYLGSIPGDKSKIETAKVVPLKQIKGAKTATVKKGLDDKAQVYMAFTTVLPPASSPLENWTTSSMVYQLGDLLDIKLREVIREDKGGSYGVNVDCETTIDIKNNKNILFTIQFGCKTARTEELQKEVLKVIKDLQTNLVDESYVQKLQEAYKRDRELKLKTNDWWNYRLKFIEFNEYSVESVNNVEILVNMITPENLRDLANKYLSTENYVTVYLKPEK